MYSEHDLTQQTEIQHLTPGKIVEYDHRGQFWNLMKRYIIVLSKLCLEYVIGKCEWYLLPPTLKKNVAA